MNLDDCEKTIIEGTAGGNNHASTAQLVLGLMEELAEITSQDKHILHYRIEIQYVDAPEDEIPQRITEEGMSYHGENGEQIYVPKTVLGVDNPICELNKPDEDGEEYPDEENITYNAKMLRDLKFIIEQWIPDGMPGPIDHDALDTMWNAVERTVTIDYHSKIPEEIFWKKAHSDIGRIVGLNKFFKYFRLPYKLRHEKLGEPFPCWIIPIKGDIDAAY